MAKKHRMAETEQPRPDPYQALQISLNTDGSLTRRPVYPSAPPTPTYDPNNPTTVLSKNVTFDPSNDAAWFRIYLPRQQQVDGAAKLPVVFYFHAGGFILCSPAETIYHTFCSDMATSLPAVVVSLGYPVAPEHRLPAAYDHGMHALHWIKTNWANIDWLRDHADFSNCFLVGFSAGANLAYHVGLRAAAAADEPSGLEIRGLVLHHPFFGGVQRTPTEARLANDPAFPPYISDLMWELSLPVGAVRDHEYCNPTAGGGSGDVDKMKALGWKVLVTGYEEDHLCDRQKAVAKMLEDKGVKDERMFKQGGQHGLEVLHPSEAKPLHTVLKKFITGADS